MEGDPTPSDPDGKNYGDTLPLDPKGNNYVW